LLSSFSDGVFFTDLSALTDPDLVVPHIAATLSLRETPGRSLTQTLRDHLSAKEMLLIADNLEQVIDAAKDIATLLTDAPQLKVLATSREALRVTGERVYSLSPLALPDPDVHTTLDDIARSPAVALFTERARAVKAGFFLTKDNASDVAAICRRLDGLPLAIELAAARVNLLSPSSLLSRLDRGLKVLSSGRRDASQRQRTLRAAIAWSYDLLSDDEYTLFRRLGVFAGGFILKAAEQVCDRGDLDTDVLDALASLIDKSLVRTVEGQDDRFSMLETIREFAQEKLEESSEAEEIRRAHAEFFRALADEQERHQTEPEQDKRLARLEADHDNLRSALGWSLEHDRPGAIVMAGALWRFWDVRGHFNEGRRWLERSLEHAGASPGEFAARALHGLASLSEAQGDYGFAESTEQEALLLYRRLDKPREVAGALSLLGWIAYHQGDLIRARLLCEQAVAKARDARDTWALGRALNGLGAVLADEDPSAAASAYEEALALQRSGNDALGVATTLLNLGELAVHDRDASRARVLLEEALEHARRLSDTSTLCAALINLALALLLDGEVQEASNLLKEGLLLAPHMGSAYVVAGVLEAAGCVAAYDKHFRRSGALFGAAHKLREQGGAPPTRSEARFHELFLGPARQSQHDGEWDEGWDEGHLMSADEAIALAATAA
ncbi:MAG: hypothetical protein LC808_22515, partial [Actinobacteria bacterium]|nr:hypothetical protein [Actinomycetota bacterium]